VKPEFLGPVVLMNSAHIDLEKGTAIQCFSLTDLRYSGR